MKFLTIDVSANVTVGVCEAADGKVKQLSVAQSADGRHHVEVLSPLVSKVLAEAQVKVPDAIVAGTGPAAFTGLRAGLSLPARLPPPGIFLCTGCLRRRFWHARRPTKAQT